MKIENLDIVLHVGYHKTGTTFLQQNIFNNLDDTVYLGRSWVHEDLETFFYDFSFMNTLNFDKVALKKRFYTILKEIFDVNSIDLSSKRMILISSESLHSGRDVFGSVIKDQANRIKQVFPNAKIILGIRKQPNMIEAYYRNYILHGGNKGFRSFLNNSYQFNSNLKVKFQYDTVISYYIQLFGKESICIIVFEEMFQNGTVNLNRLTDFLKTKELSYITSKIVNKKLSNFSVSIIRFINLIVFNDHDEIYGLRLKGKSSLKEIFRWAIIKSLKRIESNRLFPKFFFPYKYLSIHQTKELKNYYNDSNINLSKLFDLKLNEYGYNSQD